MMTNFNKPNTKHTKERGSAFVFILIGVALFAALSYAVTQSLRVTSDSGTTAMGNAEKSSLAITDMQQFLEALTMRTFHITSGNGVSENLIDFQNDVYKLSDGSTLTNNINPSCSVADCSIFSPYAPDGLTPIIFSDAADSTAQTALTLSTNGHGQIHQIAIDGVGSPAPDLVFIIHGVRATLCNAYNAKQGLSTTYDNTTTLSSIGENSLSSVPDTFTGTFNTTNDFGTGATTFRSRKSFCAPSYSDAQTNRLGIWHVLKTR